MFIVKDGYIYVGVSLLLAAIVYYFFGAVWAVIPVVLALYFATSSAIFTALRLMIPTSCIRLQTVR